MNNEQLEQQLSLAHAQIAVKDEALNNSLASIYCDFSSHQHLPACDSLLIRMKIGVLHANAAKTLKTSSPTLRWKPRSCWMITSG